MEISKLSRQATLVIQPQDVLAIQDSGTINKGYIECSVKVNISSTDTFTVNDEVRKIKRTHEAEPHLKLYFNDTFFTENAVKNDFINDSVITVDLEELTKNDTKISGIVTHYSNGETVIPLMGSGMSDAGGMVLLNGNTAPSTDVVIDWWDGTSSITQSDEAGSWSISSLVAGIEGETTENTVTSNGQTITISVLVESTVAA